MAFKFAAYETMRSLFRQLRPGYKCGPQVCPLLIPPRRSMQSVVVKPQNLLAPRLSTAEGTCTESCIGQCHHLCVHLPGSVASTWLPV